MVAFATLLDRATSAAMSVFGQAVTVNGQTVQAVFDDAFALGSVGVTGIAGTQPTLSLPTALLVGEPVGQAVVVNAASYIVAAHEPDGTGMSLLRLERA